MNAADWGLLFKLCHFSPDSRLKLLYRGTEDGFSAYAFHDKCDEVPNVLTIIRSTESNVFGGFRYTINLFDSKSIFSNKLF